jgi:hypothetical protein
MRTTLLLTPRLPLFLSLFIAMPILDSTMLLIDMLLKNHDVEELVLGL